MGIKPEHYVVRDALPAAPGTNWGIYETIPGGFEVVVVGFPTKESAECICEVMNVQRERIEPSYSRNIERRRIRLYYADLEPVHSDSFRRDCPFCLDGVLLLARGKDGKIVPRDMCISCAQRVEYVDVNQIESGGSEGPLPDDAMPLG